MNPNARRVVLRGPTSVGGLLGSSSAVALAAALLLSGPPCLGLEMRLQAPPEAWEQSEINTQVQDANGQWGGAVFGLLEFGAPAQVGLALPNGGSISTNGRIDLFAETALYQVSTTINLAPGVAMAGTESRLFFHLEETVRVDYSSTFADGLSGEHYAHHGLLIVDFGAGWNWAPWDMLVSDWSSVGGLAGNSVVLDPGNYWIYTNVAANDYGWNQDGSISGIVGDATGQVTGGFSFRFTRVSDGGSTLVLFGIGLVVFGWVAHRRTAA